MARKIKITIRTKSGDVADYALTAEAAEMTLEKVASEFMDGARLTELVTLKIENRIYFVREIESFTFT